MRGHRRQLSGPRKPRWHLRSAGLFTLVILVLAASCGFSPVANAIGEQSYIENSSSPGDFALVEAHRAVAIHVDSSDFWGVLRAAGDLQADIQRVTGQKPALDQGSGKVTSHLIQIGTLGKSETIDQLVRDRKIDVSAIKGKWESFLVQVVRHPLPGVESALVIAGSDKRGTIYGIYDLSEQIGVSPWYWWADVPVRHRDALFVKPGAYVQGPPTVKYRGIFLNDEEPSLGGWVRATYGGFNHEFYTKVFELLLRLKANYLWPAMWDSAFNEDDPLNPKLADAYGIVMGTSHLEPMLRAQQEWQRHGIGPWNYSKNAAVLNAFWTKGIERNRNYESIITLGMRGNGDLPMSPTANVALLEKIVADQRKILAEHMNKDLTKIPQDWALYKEVQTYYEKGMRVPDDVTLLWCDDNWGNIRRLPTPQERSRGGGAGIYYHFDYVGDPRSYKWINTNPLPKIWEQMNLAYRYDANRIWIVNVGDLKPMELPISFFLSLAWNPDRWPKEKISEFTRLWAAQQFGSRHSAEIADLLSKYAKYNGRRKPELLEPGTYSVTNFQEADRIENAWKSLTWRAEALDKQLPADARDAFFELVLYPVKASAVVNELYIAVAKNRLYASQGRASTNDRAKQARALFQEDAKLSAYYNHVLAGGKWNHMMDQTHIGYTSWNQPATNIMPAVKELQIPAKPQMGVAIDGSALSWPGASVEPVLPTLDAFNQERTFVDIFNRGSAPFDFAVKCNQPWLNISESHGTVEKQTRIWIGVDWSKAPKGLSTGSITISGNAGPSVTVSARAFDPGTPTRQNLKGFVEAQGFVSIEAAHFTANIGAGSVRWEEIPDLGRTLSGMSVFPVTSPSATPPQNSPHLEYRMYLFDSGEAKVEATISPTLNFVPGRGLRYAISMDDDPPQVIDSLAVNTTASWSKAVEDSVRQITSSCIVRKPGYHVLKFWYVDPGVVLQRLLVSFREVPHTYLGPPESYHAGLPNHGLRPSYSGKAARKARL
jgi:Glycosyl hydrolase family 115/Gylcosyl hydrolase family 115 C-terminal domain